jgi:hypothetical protein
VSTLDQRKVSLLDVSHNFQALKSRPPSEATLVHYTSLAPLSQRGKLGSSSFPDELLACSTGGIRLPTWRI